MYTLVLVMALGLNEGVTSQQIPGYSTLAECGNAINNIYSPKNDSYKQFKAVCVPSPPVAKRTIHSDKTLFLFWPQLRPFYYIQYLA
ncbi:hypothetical protein [Klebsiella pneumoniae]|uniref:hypothetical protein n=1 Tax=Klebsiella pneumoniae TaxID=573 RepID=UPI0039B45218